MTRKEAKELLPIVQAFAEGKTIEVRVGNDNWVETDEVYGGRNNDYFYRVKPNSKYRPFKDAEECLSEIQKHPAFGWIKNENGMYNIIRISNYYIVICLILDISRYDYGKALGFTFMDGTPFGIKDE